MKKKICWWISKNAVYIMLLSLILLPFSPIQSFTEEPSKDTEAATVKVTVIETRVDSMAVTFEESETASELSKAKIAGIVAAVTAVAGIPSNISEETAVPTSNQ